MRNMCQEFIYDQQFGRDVHARIQKVLSVCQCFCLFVCLFEGERIQIPISAHQRNAMWRADDGPR